MKIAVIVAMDKELALMLEMMPGYKTESAYGVTFYHGTIGKNDIVAAKCGIGKVNAALNTYKILKEIKPELVINSGVAGGAGNGMSIGDVLVADSVAYHDVWCGPSTEYGAADGLPVMLIPSRRISELTDELKADNNSIKTGLICSGDKFITKAEEVAEIKSHFPDVKAIDMESAPIAQTCMLNGVDFAIVRVVSDTPGEGENVSQYQDFWQKAPQKTFAVVNRLLSEL